MIHACRTLRLTALATMKSMGPGGFAATLGASSRHGSTFLTARSRNASMASLMPGMGHHPATHHQDTECDMQQTLLVGYAWCAIECTLCPRPVLDVYTC